MRLLAGTGVMASHGAPQAWLPVPERWSGDEFTEAVRAKGVGVTPGSAFAIGRSNGPHGVRIALCSQEHDETVAQTLGTIAGMLGAGSGHIAGTRPRFRPRLNDSRVGNFAADGCPLLALIS